MEVRGELEEEGNETEMGDILGECFELAGAPSFGKGDQKTRICCAQPLAKNDKIGSGITLHSK